MKIKKILTSGGLKRNAKKVGLTEDEYVKLRENGFKFCGTCKIWKNESCFGKDSGRNDGLESRCKECMSKKDTICHFSKKGKFKMYKGRAKHYNIQFNLTFEEFESFWQKTCSYCGSEIATIGIDRVDNTKGYILENCVSCCTMCNAMKMTSTEGEFLEHLLKIVKFSKLM